MRTILPALICPILGVLAVGLAIAPGQARTLQTETGPLEVETVVEGLEHPWGMAFLPDGRILVTERPGRLRVVADGRLLPDPVSGVPQVVAAGQGGLLDVALHPDFAENRLVYLTLAGSGRGGAATQVHRGRLTDGDGGLRLADVEMILEAQPYTGRRQHYGSRLAFAPDGTLFVSTGDRGERDRSQDPDDMAGSILRIHDDGRVPEDNPFVGRTDARPEIYAIGIRNAQGLAIHPETGALWENEHGPRGGDEINIIRPGRNYGWPVITHGREYSGGQVGDGLTEAPGMEQPLLVWTPSIGPSGMAFYTGEAFPDWQGDVFVGALPLRHLRRVVLDGEQVVHQEELLGELGHRIRDVRQGPDGLLYLLVDDSRAPMLRLRPAS